MKINLNNLKKIFCSFLNADIRWKLRKLGKFYHLIFIQENLNLEDLKKYIL